MRSGKYKEIEKGARANSMRTIYLDGSFYLFSEGGLKFKALRDNKNVSLAIFDGYSGFGTLKGLQVQGTASLIEPFSEEYIKLLDYKKIPIEGMKKLPKAMT